MASCVAEFGLDDGEVPEDGTIRFRRDFAATHGVALPDWPPERVEAVKKQYAERPTQG
jgi:hypothetical protein